MKVTKPHAWTISASVIATLSLENQGDKIHATKDKKKQQWN
jgi:hypothetical protein